MKICFIGARISNAFEGDIVGGAEKQQMLIIQGLKNHGVDVIVLEYYLEEAKVINGVEFIPAWKNHRDSFIKRIRNIESQINKHNVTAIYARGTQFYIAFLYFHFKMKRSKIKRYWGIAGDHDLTSKFNYLRVNQISSLYGKLNAGVVFNLSSILSFYFSDTIICQTKEQLVKCNSISKRKSAIEISNIYSSSLNMEINEIDADAIWIGKFLGNKGEEVLLNIAREIPQMNIICLGHVSDNFKKSKIYQEILNQRNIILKGRVPNNRVSYFISTANFVLNTSPSEGLSNVFLEGWDLEKPVISYLVNPNEYLTKGNAGYCADGSYKHLVLKLQKIHKDKEFMDFHGKKGKELLIKNHSSKNILSKYLTLFQKK